MSTSPTPLPSASSYRKRRQEGRIWVAPSGEPIRVRTLDLSDHIVLNKFPDYLRRMIYATLADDVRLGFQTGETEGSDDAPEEDPNPFAGLSPEEVLQREYEISTTLCKMSWLVPEVVDEVTDPENQIAVTELEADDRRAFMVWVFNTYAQEAQQLTPFPEGSGEGVGSVPGVPGPTPEPKPAPPAGAAIFRADSV